MTCTDLSCDMQSVKELFTLFLGTLPKGAIPRASFMSSFCNCCQSHLTCAHIRVACAATPPVTSSRPAPAAAPMAALAAQAGVPLPPPPLAPAPGGAPLSAPAPAARFRGPPSLFLIPPTAVHPAGVLLRVRLLTYRVGHGWRPSVLPAVVQVLFERMFGTRSVACWLVVASMKHIWLLLLLLLLLMMMLLQEHTTLKLKQAGMEFAQWYL